MFVPSPTPHINAIGTANPGHDIHRAFIDWAEQQLADPRERGLFGRMVKRSGIDHRWSVLPKGSEGGSPVMPGGFYANGMPPTSDRMGLYGQAAPDLAIRAIENLADTDSLQDITHIIVASCTGFAAPGVDQIIVRKLGLRHDIERTAIGFMGCYGAATALRNAWHIVRSQPGAKVLVVTVELSTLHLQPDRTLEPLLAMLLFGDGAAAALVSAEESGLAMARQFAATLPDSQELIRWHVGDTGFAMHLSGEVPGRIGEALAEDGFRTAILGGASADAIDGWAIHAGGRSILDSVEHALDLDDAALDPSRRILRDKGNMSSATLMFVLADILAGKPVERGVAMAFGPGLAAEGFNFRSAK